MWDLEGSGDTESRRFRFYITGMIRETTGLAMSCRVVKQKQAQEDYCGDSAEAASQSRG